SYWSFSGTEQRALVTVYVGDDQAAVDSARAALATTGDPNRQVIVVAATPVPTLLILLVLVDPRYQPDDVVAKMSTELLDEQRGVFGSGHLRIGESVFHSQIAAACLRVEGALSLRASLFITVRSTGPQFELEPRHAPGEGAFFYLHPQLLWIF